MLNYKSWGRTVFNIFNHIILLATCLLCVLPFVNLLAISFSSSTAVAAGSVVFWPKDFTLASYEFTLSDGKFIRAMMISIGRVVIGVSLNLILIILTAYPLSKTKQQLAGRSIYVIFFVITMLIGGGLIPTYLLVSGLGLKNTIWSLVLPGALPVGNMVIFMNFIRSLPEEIEEAAVIDGATPMQVLMKVLLPILKPAIATVGLFCIVNHWNDWFSGMIYMTSTDKYPLQTYLQSMLLSIEQMMQQVRQSGGDMQSVLTQINARTGRAAQLFLGAIPVMLIYPYLQKYFTKGLILGSIKG